MSSASIDTNGYFKKLTDLVSDWHTAAKDDPSLHAERLVLNATGGQGGHRYVRLQRDGYRLISIDTENPCGNAGSKSGKTISKVKTCIDGGYKAKIPDSNKPEARLQAYLIYQCLRYGPEHAARMLDPKGQLVDRLWFVADEARLGEKNIRADMLFVGSKGKQAFPILAELKANRTLGKVVEQLDNMYKAVSDPTTEVSFSNFLKESVPHAAGDFDWKFEALQKWIIWPAVPSGKPSSSVGDSAAKDQRLKVIELHDSSEKVSGEDKLRTRFDFDANPLIFIVAHPRPNNRSMA